MTRRLHATFDTDEPLTAMPRSQAGFILDSAKWVMGFLATILTTLLVGGGYMITMQVQLSADNAEFREMLRQHSAQLTMHEKKLSEAESDRVMVVDMRSQLKGLQDVHVASMETLGRRIDGQDQRMQMHTQAIVTAEGLLNAISAKQTELVGDSAANRAWHDSINRRVDSVEKAIEQIYPKKVK